MRLRLCAAGCACEVVVDAGKTALGESKSRGEGGGGGGGGRSGVGREIETEGRAEERWDWHFVGDGRKRVR
jgi:hypothetical protein